MSVRTSLGAPRLISRDNHMTLLLVFYLIFPLFISMSVQTNLGAPRLISRANRWTLLLVDKETYTILNPR